MPELKNYTVTGSIKCIFQPYRGYDDNEPQPVPAPTEHYLAGLEVQLWHKSPLHIIQLGSGMTDQEGGYTITFSNDSLYDTEDEDAPIRNVFMRVYYQGVLIAGDVEQAGNVFQPVLPPVEP